MPRKRLRFKRLSAETQRLLATEGESGRFEFKENETAVNSGVLTAAANAVLLDGIEQGYVTILVGGQEVEDSETGVVTGNVVGISNHGTSAARKRSLEKAKEKIQGKASSVRPVPVGLQIFEENISTRRPILRLRVSPTFAPHYTTKGLRVTRYGASTRAIDDEELLDLYLKREAETFRERFDHVAAGVLEKLGVIERSVEAAQFLMEGPLTSALDNILSEASDAAYDAQTTRDHASEAEGYSRAAWNGVTRLTRLTPWGIASDLGRLRQRGLRTFLDATRTVASEAEIVAIEKRLRLIATRLPDSYSHSRNDIELRIWEKHLDAQDSKVRLSTIEGWESLVGAVETSVGLELSPNLPERSVENVGGTGNESETQGVRVVARCLDDPQSRGLHPTRRPPPHPLRCRPVGGRETPRGTVCTVQGGNRRLDRRQPRPNPPGRARPPGWHPPHLRHRPSRQPRLPAPPRHGRLPHRRRRPQRQRLSASRHVHRPPLPHQTPSRARR